MAQLYLKLCLLFFWSLWVFFFNLFDLCLYLKSARKSQTVTILQALNKAALPVLESHHNHGQPPTKVHLLNSLVKLAERELVHLINWAKNVPGEPNVL